MSLIPSYHSLHPSFILSSRQFLSCIKMHSVGAYFMWPANGRHFLDSLVLFVKILCLRGVVLSIASYLSAPTDAHHQHFSPSSNDRQRHFPCVLFPFSFVFTISAKSYRTCCIHLFQNPLEEWLREDNETV